MQLVTSLPSKANTLLAIDPGKSGGWAYLDLWASPWRLTDCGLCDPTRGEEIALFVEVVLVEVPHYERQDGPPSHAKTINKALRASFEAGLSDTLSERTFLLTNKPPVEIYNITKTAFRAGRLVRGCSYDYLWIVSPHDWKRAVPKRIHNERTKAKLTVGELEVLSASRKADGRPVPKSQLHNVVDAIGLGLWGVGR